MRPLPSQVLSKRRKVVGDMCEQLAIKARAEAQSHEPSPHDAAVNGALTSCNYGEADSMNTASYTSVIVTQDAAESAAADAPTTLAELPPLPRLKDLRVTMFNPVVLPENLPCLRTLDLDECAFIAVRPVARFRVASPRSFPTFSREFTGQVVSPSTK